MHDVEEQRERKPSKRSPERRRAIGWDRVTLIIRGGRENDKPVVKNKIKKGVWTNAPAARHQRRETAQEDRVRQEGS